MALPKPTRPEYNLTIPSTGKRIKYMPFSVREEKVLILAAESQATDEISNAIRNTLERCVTTPGFKVDELALFDIEFLFLKCRAKSAGETIKIIATDPADESFSREHEIDIDKIKVEKTKNHTDLIELSEDCTVKMKYPDLSFFETGIDLNDVASMSSALTRCISQIIIGEEVYSSADMSTEEVEEWVDGLTQIQYQKIISFFETMPKLRHEFTIKNTKTNNDFTIRLEGLADFF
jgi:hypothetical protein